MFFSLSLRASGDVQCPLAAFQGACPVHSCKVEAAAGRRYEAAVAGNVRLVALSASLSARVGAGHVVRACRMALLCAASIYLRRAPLQGGFSVRTSGCRAVARPVRGGEAHNPSGVRAVFRKNNSAPADGGSYLDQLAAVICLGKSKQSEGRRVCDGFGGLDSTKRTTPDERETGRRGVRARPDPVGHCGFPPLFFDGLFSPRRGRSPLCEPPSAAGRICGCRERAGPIAGTTTVLA